MPVVTLNGCLASRAHSSEFWAAFTELWAANNECGTQRIEGGVSMEVDFDRPQQESYRICREQGKESNIYKIGRLVV